ncbi:hypothetical protein GCM10017044_21640 [Kordiimonas sediminis]|uniref:Uncharacterized protein n=1 Tax=Kordiimonas sediminis TaxID=1735581 RepID=A0A919E7F5_9PROT|nr:hypothetical protein GCM10017044_21640 [Kordiimonas sediminis]
MELYYVSGCAALFCFYKYFTIAKAGQHMKSTGASVELLEWYTSKASSWFSYFLMALGLTAISYFL